jgi:hypothetical protein
MEHYYYIAFNQSKDKLTSFTLNNKTYFLLSDLKDLINHEYNYCVKDINKELNVTDFFLFEIGKKEMLFNYNNEHSPDTIEYNFINPFSKKVDNKSIFITYFMLYQLINYDIGYKDIKI